MESIPHCPNRNCPSNNKNHKVKVLFRKKGFEKSKRKNRIQRYQCKICKRTFNANIFNIDFYTHRHISYRQLVQSLVSSSGIRDMARQFRCSTSVIQNRIKRLAKKAIALSAPLLNNMDLQENLTADGLESFILSQFFPTNINVLVGSRSQFIYFFNCFYFHRKGRMTSEQKIKALSLYKKAYFEKRAPSNSFRELLDSVAELMDKSSKKKLILDTDENRIYSNQFKQHPRLNGVKHRKTNSKEERNTQNKLFSCNYLDRMIRKNQAEHIRETVQYSRNINHSMNRFTVYSFWSNYIGPHRVNKKSSSFKTHAEAAGLSRDMIRSLGKRFYDASWIHRIQIDSYLTSFQSKIWAGSLLNPINPLYT